MTDLFWKYSQNSKYNKSYDFYKITDCLVGNIKPLVEICKHETSSMFIKIKTSNNLEETFKIFEFINQ